MAGKAEHTREREIVSETERKKKGGSLTSYSADEKIIRL